MLSFITFGVAVLVVGFASECPPLDYDEQDDEKIVGGYVIEIEGAPYQVSWQFKDNGTFKHFCGGSLISEKFVVSAAHCFFGFIETKLRIGSSCHDCGGDLVSIKNFIVHPDWGKNNENIYDSDIALLELEESVEFTEKVQPIKLSTNEQELEAGELSYATGWGKLHSNATDLPSRLMAVELPIVDRDECNSSLRKYWPQDLTERMICAGFMSGGKDSCQGDSGGPLVRKSDGTLIGIISWGLGCAEPDKPGVYTNVAFFRDWIREMTGV